MHLQFIAFPSRRKSLPILQLYLLSMVSFRPICSVWRASHHPSWLLTALSKVLSWYLIGIALHIFVKLTCYFLVNLWLIQSLFGSPHCSDQMQCFIVTLRTNTQFLMFQNIVIEPWLKVKTCTPLIKIFINTGCYARGEFRKRGESIPWGNNFWHRQSHLFALLLIQLRQNQKPNLNHTHAIN